MRKKKFRYEDILEGKKKQTVRMYDNAYEYNLDEKMNVFFFNTVIVIVWCFYFIFYCRAPSCGTSYAYAGMHSLLESKYNSGRS